MSTARSSFTSFALLLVPILLLSCNADPDAHPPPTERYIIDPAPRDLDSLRAVLQAFSEVEGLEYIESKYQLPSIEGVPDYFYVGLQGEREFHVYITNSGRLDQIYIFIYEPVPTDLYLGFSDRLVEALKVNWPHIERFTGL